MNPAITPEVTQELERLHQQAGAIQYQKLVNDSQLLQVNQAINEIYKKIESQKAPTADAVG